MRDAPQPARLMIRPIVYRGFAAWDYTGFAFVSTCRGRGDGYTSPPLPTTWSDYGDEFEARPAGPGDDQQGDHAGGGTAHDRAHLLQGQEPHQGARDAQPQFQG